jgi:hypothetical protein
MSEIERATDALGHPVHRNGKLARLVRRKAFTIRDGADGVIATGLFQEVEDAELPRLGNAPRHDELAADAIDMNGRLLQHYDIEAGAGQRNGQRAAGQSGADDHGVGLFVQARHG